MNKEQLMQITGFTKEEKKSLEFFPIVSNGFENPKENIEIHPEFLYEWFGNRYEHGVTNYFIEGGIELKGVRILYSKEFKAQTENGNIEFGTEVFLLEKGRLVKFHAFRKTNFCNDCKRNHTILHRMIAEDQEINHSEQDAILNNVSVTESKKSKDQLPVRNKKQMKNQLPIKQNKAFEEATKLWFPPIYEDGLDLKGLYDQQAYNENEKGYPKWMNLELLLTDAGSTFPLCGMRVLYYPKNKL